MKRRNLLRHLEKYGCYLLREGAKHSVYRNKNTGEQASVPRHNEVDNATARAICRKLGVLLPSEK